MIIYFIFVLMTRGDKIKVGMRRNTLLRYQDVLDVYFQTLNDYRYIKPGEIYIDFIKPKFRISRTTFYKILATPVKKELEALELLEKQLQQQLEMF